MLDRRIWITLVVLAIPLLYFWVLGIVSWRGRPPGVTGGKLALGPDKPNWVSSHATDAEHQIQPLACGADPAADWQRLLQILAAQPRTRIVTSSDEYIHAESTSLFFRFVDDLELMLNRDEKQIEVRSASRVGYSDVGANRARVEALRAKFQAK